ncbi:transcriptional regulator [Pyrodictium abyssi]|uniref:Uncharacterized protein n=1 Tax=Pyrodictium abyssi TaxID=54256 RepID=A0ABM8IYH5_9CREN|nr:hypothetical protein PABY_21620 [Pyrodictium abyssi]
MAARVWLTPEEWALLIIGLAGSELRGATTLQKLGFLGVMEAGGEGLEYVPWKYGPFSEDLHEAVKQLRREGLLKRHVVFENRMLYTATVYVYELTPRGEAEFRKLLRRLEKEHPDFLRRMREIVEEWKDKPFHLLYYVYKRYKDWTYFSEIRDEVMRLGRLLERQGERQSKTRGS